MYESRLRGIKYAISVLVTLTCTSTWLDERYVIEKHLPESTASRRASSSKQLYCYLVLNEMRFVGCRDAAYPLLRYLYLRGRPCGSVFGSRGTDIVRNEREASVVVVTFWFIQGTAAWVWIKDKTHAVAAPRNLHQNTSTLELGL